MAPDTIFAPSTSTNPQGAKSSYRNSNDNTESHATSKPPRRRSSMAKTKDADGSSHGLWSRMDRYASRKSSSPISISELQLPLELDAIGFKSVWAYVWIFLFGVAPFCHIYIGLIVFRELCLAFDSFQQTIHTYFSWLDIIATALHSRSSRVMEFWCLLEALFYVVIKAKIAYLQTRDPLEASLSAAPLLDPSERRQLWNRIIECEYNDPIAFLRGWFFDVALEQISRYDVYDFICWSMFDGRSPEHLTMEECRDLEDFVQELEWIISLQLYGEATATAETKTKTAGDVTGVPDDAEAGDEEQQQRTDERPSLVENPSGPDASLSETQPNPQPQQQSDTTTNDKRSQQANPNDVASPSRHQQPSRPQQQKKSMSSPSKFNRDIHAASPLRQRWNITPTAIPSSGSAHWERSMTDANSKESTGLRHIIEDDPSDMSWSDEGSFGSCSNGRHHPRPKQIFRFSVDSTDHIPGQARDRWAHGGQVNDDGTVDTTFAPFAGMYDSVRHRYEQFQRMVENSDFHPIQDFVRFMEETALEIHKAEEAAYNHAQTMYRGFMNTSREGNGMNAEQQQKQQQQQQSGSERSFAPAVTTATTDDDDAEFDSDSSHTDPQQQIGNTGERTAATATSAGEGPNDEGATPSQTGTARKQLWTSVSTQLKDTRMMLQQRFETAKFWSAQRKALQDQLRGNRAMLSRMREMSYAVPAKQMAALMRNITEGHHALERTEHRAKEVFVNATSILYNSRIGQQSTNMARNFVTALQQSTGVGNGVRQEPKRYAKYSSDPLLGISTYPLGMHALVLGATEIPLRIMMRNRGFERRCVGPVSYYYHPGKAQASPRGAMGGSGPNAGGGLRGMGASSSPFFDPSGRSPYFQQQPGKRSEEKIPLVFVHGIGIGIIFYMPLVDWMLETGRPILLPEIPFVSGFRPWQGPNSVLSPAVVASTMTAMLAIHGFSKGAFLAHSYGSTWLSYMCKYAKSTVAALLFLDPICFCLHYSRLTKSFVYHRADPGTSSFMVRTDIIVNWTIQRSFPWSWIILFAEQMEGIPCTIFLGDKDALVPAEKVESYVKTKGAPVCDFEDALATDGEFFYRTGEEGDLNLCVFRGHYHGQWCEEPDLCVPTIGKACDALCKKVEERMALKRME